MTRRTNDYAEKVAYNQKLKQYAENLEKYSESRTSWYQKANESLMNIILFPRGWLSFSMEEITVGVDSIHKGFLLLVIN